jgi:hypothetical protein
MAWPKLTNSMPGPCLSYEEVNSLTGIGFGEPDLIRINTARIKKKLKIMNPNGKLNCDNHTDPQFYKNCLYKIVLKTYQQLSQPPEQHKNVDSDAANTSAPGWFYN